MSMKRLTNAEYRSTQKPLTDEKTHFHTGKTEKKKNIFVFIKRGNNLSFQRKL